MDVMCTVLHVFLDIYMTLKARNFCLFVCLFVCLLKLPKTFMCSLNVI